MYPGVDVTNVVESSVKVTISNWCQVDKPNCRHPEHTVTPYKCVGECLTSFTSVMHSIVPQVTGQIIEFADGKKYDFEFICFLQWVHFTAKHCLYLSTVYLIICTTRVVVNQILGGARWLRMPVSVAA